MLLCVKIELCVHLQIHIHRRENNVLPYQNKINLLGWKPAVSQSINPTRREKARKAFTPCSQRHPYVHVSHGQSIQPPLTLHIHPSNANTTPKAQVVDITPWRRRYLSFDRNANHHQPLLLPMRLFCHDVFL